MTLLLVFCVSSLFRRCCAALLVWSAIAISARADDTWTYAVQVSAEVRVSPPRITLHWSQDRWGANSFSIYRKSKEAQSWGSPIAALPGNATAFQDDNVQVGAAYEYQIVKDAIPGYKGYGYVYAGIKAPLVENRGKIILVIESNATAGLEPQITRLRSDLVGDGWEVLQYQVSSNDTPETVKSLILGTYYSDPQNINTVFLLGHVPVLHSGNLNWDGHAERPVPADSYYGHVNGSWPTEPGRSPSYIPSDVTLMVGRVDFFNMPGLGADTPWPSETELLRNYLEKDHRWRHKQYSVPRRALMGNERGDEEGVATAASGYRSFQPLVGPGNIIEANTKFDTPDSERWMSKLSQDAYLWAYGCGGGFADGCGGLGTHVVNGVPGFLYSRDVVALDAKAVFVMMFGSWFGDWDRQDDLLRSFLATRSYGLASVLSGWPHCFMHHMGLGEPIGYSVRLSINNSTLYRNQVNGMTRAAYVALMGDPTLRMEPVAPPSNLSGWLENGAAALSWQPSAQEVIGYHVYRATSPDGPFTRLTSELISTTSFKDNSLSPAKYYYMVRAVALEENPSGSYFNPSQGIFAALDTAHTQPPEPITLYATLTAGGVKLDWNTQPGQVYRLQAADFPDNSDWHDLAGPLTASGSSLSWTDYNIQSKPARLYRVVSP